MFGVGERWSCKWETIFGFRTVTDRQSSCLGLQASSSLVPTTTSSLAVMAGKNCCTTTVTTDASPTDFSRRSGALHRLRGRVDAPSTAGRRPILRYQRGSPEWCVPAGPVPLQYFCVPDAPHRCRCSRAVSPMRADALPRVDATAEKTASVYQGDLATTLHVSGALGSLATSMFPILEPPDRLTSPPSCLAILHPPCLSLPRWSLRQLYHPLR